jgi:membrane protein implicated in regulation of membrane protease activity
MLVAIRPLLARKFHHGTELKTGSAHVIGRTGTVVKEIHPDGGGSIRLGGDLWTARPFDEVSTIAPGTRVEIMSIDGATAVVYPVGDSLHQLDNPQPTEGPKPTDPPQS